MIMQLGKGTTAFELEEMFNEEAWDALSEVEPDGQKGTIEATVRDFGKISVWLGACSEGADRGGYVTFVKLRDISGPDGEPIVLERDSSDGWLFEGRSWEL